MVKKRAKKNTGKQHAKKESVIDTTIIEHLACLEINNLILQPPFRLISNIQWNDKGVSFDGTIDVYSHQKIEKSNYINDVAVQVKGTTIQKTVIRQNKIRHSVKKKDLEVYYKHGRGILYFVVTINPKTYVRQAYYRILAPLDLKGILLGLNKDKKDSITIDFYKLEKGDLESVCKTVIDVVKKQPQQYIEAKEEMEFTHYKVEFIDVKEDSFNVFEETAYIYGFNSDSIGKPIEATKVSLIESNYAEVVFLDNEEKKINYQIKETKENYKVIIEDTLTFDLNKENKSGGFHLGKLRTLSSYIKCLQLINYYIEFNELPFQYFKLGGEMKKTETFGDIKSKIQSYKDLLHMCAQLGINENYIIGEEENLSSLFSNIVQLFKNKEYHMLNIGRPRDTEGIKLCSVELSDNIRVKLIYTGDKFINFYSTEALSTIGGLLPKKTFLDNRELHKVMSDSLPENWEDYYQRVSIYSNQKIEEMVEDANFDFEILKLSFSDKYHDIKVDGTLNLSLDYMNYYNKCMDEKYLDLALELNQRNLVELSKEDIPKINIYLVKLMRGNELSEEEQEDVMNIQERAESEKNTKNQQIRFACEVLLGNKMKAKRIFNSLEKEEQEEMLDYPIYHHYNKL